MARINRSALLPPEGVSSEHHVISRCSRELHLLGGGGGAETGEPDDLRKELLLAQLEKLVEQMAVVVIAFAIMENHVHLVLRIRVELAAGWSAEEVVRRWLALHPLRDGYHRPRSAEEDELAALAADGAWVEATRKKLMSLSEFMKTFKQHATLQLNRLEGVGGPAWQGRFKSVPINDVEQLVATMIYVDLNPFAAGECETPEDGRYTSLCGRLGRDEPAAATAPASAERGGEASANPDGTQLPSLPRRRACGAWLPPMDETADAQWKRGGRPLADGSALAAAREGCVTAGLSLGVYLRLLDAVARKLREGKHRLRAGTRGIFERLGLDGDAVTGRVLAMRVASG